MIVLYDILLWLCEWLISDGGSEGAQPSMKKMRIIHSVSKRKERNLPLAIQRKHVYILFYSI